MTDRKFHKKTLNSMLKKLIVLLSITFFFVGCSGNKQKVIPLGAISLLEDKYSKNFVGLGIPTKSVIKEQGHNIGRIKITFEKIWEAMIIVAMQKAPIVYLDKNNGIMVAPPFAFYAEDDFNSGIKLYAYLMKDLYKDKDVPTRYFVEIHSDDQDRILRTILGQIITQLQATNKLWRDGRWSYLNP